MKDANDNKITLLQALLIYVVAMHTASMRFTSTMTTNTAHQAAWLSVFPSLIIYIPLLYVLCKTGRKFEGKSLHDILCGVFGKFLGKAISVIIVFWLMILLGLYLKYTAGNLVTTIFVGTDETLLIFTAIALVGVMLRWGIAVIARMNKLIFVFIVVQFLVTLLFLFLHFRPDFVTPVSTLDIVPILSSAIFPLTIFAYITPMFIFNDQILYDKKNTGKFAFAVLYTTIKNALMILALIGMLGYQIIGKLRLPFFSAVENISLFNSSAGVDSLFMSIWILAEFITLTFFTYCISRMLKGIFNLNGETPLLTPLLGFAFFFAIYFSSDIFQLTLFSARIVPYLNLSLGVALPFLVFGIGKIRKKI